MLENASEPVLPAADGSELGSGMELIPEMVK
jgi:hypothetical protein